MLLFFNSRTNYGVMSRALHWLTALTVFGMFALGIWMVGLDYFTSDWYEKGPELHKSIGMLLLFATLFRIFWIKLTPAPPLDAHMKSWEKRLAEVTHKLLYLLLLLVLISGYFISTSNGTPIDVFGWFSVPALGNGIENQASIFGNIHEILAYALVCVALLHGLAALKHHFIDKDNSLKKMLGIAKS